MKKTMLLLSISIFATALLFSATALISKNMSNKVAECANHTSSVYEVVEFIPPTKQVYELNEINNYIQNPDCSNHTLEQDIDFDGAGMSMTVLDSEGNQHTYDYACDFFEIDGQMLKLEDYFTFDFNVEDNVNEYGILSEGFYTANVILTTDDGEYITQDFDFLIENTPKTSDQTQLDNQSQIENNSQAQAPTEKSPKKNNLVMPTIKKNWDKVNKSGEHIEILRQKGNNFTMIITNSNYGAKMVSTEVSFRLNNVYISNGVIKGDGYFHYTDSLKRTGTGHVKVSKNSIVLDMNEDCPLEYSSGWLINTSTGKYI